MKPMLALNGSLDISRRLAGAGLTVVLLFFVTPCLWSQDVGAEVFEGSWTYRSFLNQPEQVDDINRILFAQAELVFEKVSKGEIAGKLNMGSAGFLTLKGAVAFGNPFSIRFQGVGKVAGSPSEGWVYDYIGWYVPSWPNGADQKPAIVGSVIRTVPHGQAKAGVVASFIAVKR